MCTSSNMELHSLYCVKSKTRYKRRISFVAFSCMPCSFPLCHSLSLSVSPLFSRLPYFTQSCMQIELCAKRKQKKKKEASPGEDGRRGGRMGVGSWSLFAYTSTSYVLCLYYLYQLCLLLRTSYGALYRVLGACAYAFVFAFLL